MFGHHRNLNFSLSFAARERQREKGDGEEKGQMQAIVSNVYLQNVENDLFLFVNGKGTR